MRLTILAAALLASTSAWACDPLIHGNCAISINGPINSAFGTLAGERSVDLPAPIAEDYCPSGNGGSAPCARPGCMLQNGAPMPCPPLPVPPLPPAIYSVAPDIDGAISKDATRPLYLGGRNVVVLGGSLPKEYEGCPEDRRVSATDSVTISPSC